MMKKWQTLICAALCAVAASSMPAQTAQAQAGGAITLMTSGDWEAVKIGNQCVVRTRPGLPGKAWISERGKTSTKIAFRHPDLMPYIGATTNRIKLAVFDRDIDEVIPHGWANVERSSTAGHATVTVLFNREEYRDIFPDVAAVIFIVDGREIHAGTFYPGPAIVRIMDKCVAGEV